MKRRFTIATAIVMLAIAGLAFGSMYQSGIYHFVGDIYMHNNDPNSDYNTAIGEQPSLTLDGSAGTVIFEGATLNAFETTLTVTDPTADNTITLPDGSATIGKKFVTCTALLVADMVDQSCWISDGVYTITAMDVVWATAESAGTLTIIGRKQEGTEAPASGQALNTAVDVVSTAETVTAATLTATGADLILADGDRIGLDFTDDTAGELAGVVVTFTLIPS